MNIFRLIAALGLAILFIYSGAMKASNLDAFAMNIAQYLLLPPFWTKPAALVITLLELSTGLLLLIPTTRRWGAMLALLLTLTFLFALTSALLRGLTINCGCLGTENGASNLWPAVWKDIAISLLAAFLLWKSRGRNSY